MVFPERPPKRREVSAALEGEQGLLLEQSVCKNWAFGIDESLATTSEFWESWALEEFKGLREKDPATLMPTAGEVSDAGTFVASLATRPKATLAGGKAWPLELPSIANASCYFPDLP